jgi:PAS domain S-box-containing protein
LYWIIGLTNKYKIKTKLLFPVVTLAIIFMILTLSVVASHYSKLTKLEELKHTTHLAIKISNILHETQKERGMSSGFLTNGSVVFQEKLKKQRLLTDKVLFDLNHCSNSIDDKKIKMALVKAFLNINILSDMRRKIDNETISAQEAISYYSSMNKGLLSIVSEISKMSTLPLITQNIMAYKNFLKAKEIAGIQRAVGVNILSINSFNNDKRIRFIKLLSAEKLYIEQFLEYASNSSIDYFKNIYRGSSIVQLQQNREMILNLDIDKNNVKINPVLWFENMTKKIDKLKKVDNVLEQEIIKNIELELVNIKQLFSIFIFLVFVGLVIFAVMIYVILNLMQSERRLKILIDKYIISSTSDLKGKIVEVSEAYSQVSGYKTSELIGKPHNIIRHPDMPKSAFADMWKTIQSGKVWHGKVKNKRKDGSSYWVQAHVEPLFDAKGKIEGYTAIRLDITQSQELEEKLKLSEREAIKQKEYLHAVIESSNSAIITVDEKRSVLTYNKKAGEIFGFKKYEMLKEKGIYKILTPRFQQILELACDLYFIHNNKSILEKKIELEAIKKNGESLPIRVSFGVSDSYGKKIIVANIIDISKEKKQDKMLQQQSKLAQMGEMISMIAHQWRQPLNAISLTSSVISMKAKKDQLDSEKVIELTKNISEYAHHLSETINDFREFFKSDKKSESVHWTEIVTDVLHIIEESIINKNISIVKKLESKDRFVSYPNELKQVVLNLIKNAEDVLLEKNIENPYIEITTYKDGKYSILEISDNGGGIPNKIIDNIFDPYFSTKKAKEGTGLGLYMSKTIVEKHCHGKLDVVNTKDGALFRITVEELAIQK